MAASRTRTGSNNNINENVYVLEDVVDVYARDAHDMRCPIAKETREESTEEEQAWSVSETLIDNMGLVRIDSVAQDKMKDQANLEIHISKKERNMKSEISEVKVGVGGTGVEMGMEVETMVDSCSKVSFCHRIHTVKEGGIADQLGLRQGDELFFLRMKISPEDHVSIRIFTKTVNHTEFLSWFAMLGASIHLVTKRIEEDKVTGELDETYNDISATIIPDQGTDMYCVDKNSVTTKPFNCHKDVHLASFSHPKAEVCYIQHASSDLYIKQDGDKLLAQALKEEDIASFEFKYKVFSGYDDTRVGEERNVVVFSFWTNHKQVSEYIVTDTATSVDLEIQSPIGHQRLLKANDVRWFIQRFAANSCNTFESLHIRGQHLALVNREVTLKYVSMGDLDSDRDVHFHIWKEPKKSIISFETSV